MHLQLTALEQIYRGVSLVDTSRLRVQNNSDYGIELCWEITEKDPESENDGKVCERLDTFEQTKH